METTHNIFIGNANNMFQVNDESIDLVITSPPYPMIEMWDDIMAKQNPLIKEALDEGRADDACELMHVELDKVWKECYRVIKEGGFLCVNIGDATRTINGEFKLYSNHSRIIQVCTEMGFNTLPCVIWRKQTNAPNKFMGSGMLPCGAYITLEHEYVLVFRKGSKRVYKNDDAKFMRKQSSFFWEERNLWFSDVWDIKGTKQSIGSKVSRDRNASFPFELPHRLINMYSQKDDVVLDPFVGLGTTMKAAMLNKRNFIGYDIDNTLSSLIIDDVASINIDNFNGLIKKRFDCHVDFIRDRENQKKEVKHYNKTLNCKVMTSQEEDMAFDYVKAITKVDDNNISYVVSYLDKTDIRELPFLSHGTLF